MIPGPESFNLGPVSHKVGPALRIVPFNVGPDLGLFRVRVNINPGRYN